MSFQKCLSEDNCYFNPFRLILFTHVTNGKPHFTNWIRSDQIILDLFKALLLWSLIRTSRIFLKWSAYLEDAWRHINKLASFWSRTNNWAWDKYGISVTLPRNVTVRVLNLALQILRQSFDKCCMLYSVTVRTLTAGKLITTTLVNRTVKGLENGKTISVSIV